MSLLTAPYNAGMKLGSGFNSYTQQQCIDHAVVHDDTLPNAPGADEMPVGTAQDTQIAQQVTFRTEKIDKLSDITDALNINGNLTVKASNIANATGAGSFINSNKVNESDLNFLISCKVVNQTIMDENLVKFTAIPNLKPENFTDVYGDCFISGFQVGGEFNALVSIKVRDKSQLEEISAKATLAFTTPGFTDKSTQTSSGDTAAGSGSSNSGLNIEADAQLSKTRNDVMSSNETTISVSWSGGGQMLKSPLSDWNFETLREAAIKFPELVAMTPVRTDAILTKYTALKSFYTSTASIGTIEPLSYENVGMYTTVLQDAYLDYKALYKDLHLLALDVEARKKVLVVASPPQTSPAPNASGESSTDSTASETSKAITPTTKIPGDDAEDLGNSDEHGNGAQATTPAKRTIPTIKPYIIQKPYDPTIVGLEQAKQDTRIMMARIVCEVDIVTKFPEVATDEQRGWPFMAPALFKLYVPISSDVSTTT